MKVNLGCGIVAVAVYIIVAYTSWFDYGQCDRRCTQNGALYGKRNSLSTCVCYDASGREISHLPRLNPVVPPPPLHEIVCTTNGTKSTQVIHGGACGQCSNNQDIQIYHITRDNLTEVATNAATLNLLIGRTYARDYFSQQTNFTDGCTECWLDNMSCTAVHCLWTCIKHRILGSSNNENDGSLNACLACDEKYCGPEFVTCAGANRRRLGIVTDIGRYDEEIFKKVNE
jgi:hypothetical protein